MQGFSIALGNGGKFLKKQQQFYFKKNTHKSIENKKPGNQHRQRNRGMQPLNNLKELLKSITTCMLPITKTTTKLLKE
jgi:hypothetical protein